MDSSSVGSMRQICAIGLECTAFLRDRLLHVIVSLLKERLEGKSTMRSVMMEIEIDVNVGRWCFEINEGCENQTSIL